MACGINSEHGITVERRADRLQSRMLGGFEFALLAASARRHTSDAVVYEMAIPKRYAIS